MLDHIVQIPFMAWKFINQVYTNMHDHEISIRAASLAYFGMFSIFPLILFIIYLGSEVLETEAARSVLSGYLQEIFPVGSGDLENIIDQSMESRDSIGIISGAGLLWGASSVFGVMESALNVIWRSRPRPFLKKRLLASISVFVLGLLFLISFFISPLVGWFITVQPSTIISVIRISIQVLVSSAAIYLFFKFFPNRGVNWKYALTGAVTSSFLILGAQGIFRIYLSFTITNYGLIYGPLAWIVALGFWVYVVAVLFFVGAEVGSALEMSQSDQ